MYCREDCISYGSNQPTSILLLSLDHFYSKNSCENDRQLDIDSERRRGSETSVNSAYEDE